MTIHSVMALNAAVRRPRQGNPGTPPGPGSPWGKSIVAPRAARRPSGKARRPRTGAPAAPGLRGGVAIPGVFEGGATPPDPASPTRQPRWGGGGMQRRSNAGGVAPRAAKRDAILRAALGLIREAIADGQHEGLFRADLKPTSAAKMLFGALDEMATNWILSRRRYSLEADADAVVDLFINGARPR